MHLGLQGAMCVEAGRGFTLVALSDIIESLSYYVKCSCRVSLLLFFPCIISLPLSPCLETAYTLHDYSSKVVLCMVLICLCLEFNIFCPRVCIKSSSLCVVLCMIIQKLMCGGVLALSCLSCLLFFYHITSYD